MRCSRCSKEAIAPKPRGGDTWVCARHLWAHIEPPLQMDETVHVTFKTFSGRSIELDMPQSLNMGEVKYHIGDGAVEWHDGALTVDGRELRYHEMMEAVHNNAVLQEVI